MTEKKRIALVAHDNCKADLIEWVKYNWQTLAAHDLTTTGTTGSLIEKAVAAEGQNTVKLTKLKSGPLGGDQQLGTLIAEEKIDAIIFFWDPMHAQPHDVDVKALLRIGVAGAAMVVVLVALRMGPWDWRALHGAMRWLWLALVIAAGAGTYVVALLALGWRPRELRHSD